MAIKTKTKTDSEKSVIYIGPDIKNLVKRHSVFISLPQSIKDFKKECPDIEHLFVVVDDFQVASEALTKKGSLNQHYYQNVSKYIKAKGA